MIRCGKVIGSVVSVSELSEVKDVTLKLAVKREGNFICIANVHMVVTAKTNQPLRNAMKDATIVTSDGMPLVWDLKRQGFKEAGRVSGPDLMVELCKKAEEEGLPIYFYGGSHAVAELMEKKLREQFPNLIIAGIESPPMLPLQLKVDQDVVKRINESGAKIVFVGLGCPKQELWMHEFSPYIPSVLIGVGAAFDFFAGNIKRAPLWMQKYGLEWFYRLIQDPKRLWRRYLVTNTLFIVYWLLERITFRK